MSAHRGDGDQDSGIASSAGLASTEGGGTPLPREANDNGGVFEAADPTDFVDPRLPQAPPDVGVSVGVCNGDGDGDGDVDIVSCRVTSPEKDEAGDGGVSAPLTAKARSGILGIQLGRKERADLDEPFGGGEAKSPERGEVDENKGGGGGILGIKVGRKDPPPPEKSGGSLAGRRSPERGEADEAAERGGGGILGIKLGRNKEPTSRTETNTKAAHGSEEEAAEDGGLPAGGSGWGNGLKRALGGLQGLRKQRRTGDSIGGDRDGEEALCPSGASRSSCDVAPSDRDDGLASPDMVEGPATMGEAALSQPFCAGAEEIAVTLSLLVISWLVLMTPDNRGRFRSLLMKLMCPFNVRGALGRRRAMVSDDDDDGGGEGQREEFERMDGLEPSEGSGGSGRPASPSRVRLFSTVPTVEAKSCRLKSATRSMPLPSRRSTRSTPELSTLFSPPRPRRRLGAAPLGQLPPSPIPERPLLVAPESLPHKAQSLCTGLVLPSASEDTEEEWDGDQYLRCDSFENNYRALIRDSGHGKLVLPPECR